MKIDGDHRGNNISGTDGNDIINGRGEGDWIQARNGDDWIDGGKGHDLVFAGEGHDIVWGGEGSDTLYGQEGDDLLYSDAPNAPRNIPKGLEGYDVLGGGPGKDTLIAGDGIDLMKGGADADAFVFSFHDPMIGGDRSYAIVDDFDPKQDRFTFDAKGLGGDQPGANFVDHSSGVPGSFVDTFYSGAAAHAKGQHVVVLTDQTYASASAAAKAISGENAGDIIVYHDSWTTVAMVAYVDSANHADSFAELNHLTLADLATMTASNFAFI
ncbi:calcium-binding protein [Neorhizobium galegae]|uniref:NodO n=1 Tax=Neorhizobium galegae bv. officinalis bv. officinalis str. HAMBI 1141 TaxID=1028801 RepID=A0A068TLK3_NEOGA|nr:calcium-binding protein [Neorhizobium galegae]CDZ42573.1 NodO [Neorhizobium galegae bv. officinalis]KAA9382322.1 calcium-binding protein [Neorhizobium galegae]MCQ1769642.1 calcium-binding protein [Neorhizobium galegae]MCQ1775289.1 calcium-binding protein [Neorhizobium galegae]MCQ1781251.1 calcium-binding protein [Neorhizobium galegae]